MSATTIDRRLSAEHADRSDDRLGELLHTALAAEYVIGLPEFMAESDFAQLAGIAVAEVRQAAANGDLLPAIGHGHRGFRPYDNLRYLMQMNSFHVRLRDHVLHLSTFEEVMNIADGDPTPGELS